MKKKNKLLIVLTIFVITFTTIFMTCTMTEPKREPVEPTAFGIEANKVIIAEKSGSIELKLKIEPGNSYPLDYEFESSDDSVATVTTGAIDESGKALTTSEIRAKKYEIEKKNRKAGEKIIVPTDSIIITAHGYGQCTITGKLGTFSDDVQVTVADKQVALTFDDGAAPPTAELLEGLEKEHVKATFFVVGEMTKRSKSHMDALKRAIADGHEIGNHSYNHIVGTEKIKSELKKTDKLIVSLGGTNTTIMRPPGGVIIDKTKECGKSIVNWSFDTMDWKYREPNVVKKRILKAKDGDIVLIHDLHATSVKGALMAIPELKAQGFYMTTVSDIIGNPEPNKVYVKGQEGQLQTGIIE